MNLLTDMPARMLALMNTGDPNAGGFLDSIKGPLLILAIALGLALVIAIVILTMQRDGGPKKSRHGRSTRLSTAKPLAPGEEGASRKKRRRHKRRRRDHRKRNPTLSETGGLPPKKEDDSGEPETEPDQ